MTLIKKKLTELASNVKGSILVAITKDGTEEALDEIIEGKEKTTVELALAANAKALKRKRKLVAKYHGKEFKPKHEGYYGEGIEPYQLLCDDVKSRNLGTGCEKTVMLHFKGEPIKKWEILKHFRLCK